MTKKELVESLKEYPDDSEIEMGFENINEESNDLLTTELRRVYGYETVIGSKIRLCEY